MPRHPPSFARHARRSIPASGDDSPQALPEQRHGAQVGRLPTPSQLAALGAVLCLHRPHSGGELAGWAQAAHAEVRTALDSDGVREELVFTDRDGRCCWRLCVLPDSDFLAWEQLCATLPSHEARCQVAHVATAGIGERLWTRLADRLRGERWQSCVLRLHALRCTRGVVPGGEPMLAASLAPLSALGAAVAQRIARDEGADADGLRDDCCCQQAARDAAARQASSLALDRREEVDLLPLVRLRGRDT